MVIKRLVFIVAGGPLGDGKFFRAQVAALNPVELICADGGACHVYAMGFIPHAVIGDMDSVDPNILKRCEEQGSRIVRHSRDKKETDTQLALEYALRAVPDEIRIYGALGGRIDHTLANISLLVTAAKRDVAVKLVDEWCEVFVVARQAVIEGTPGQTISLLPLSSAVSGIELQGFEYPLSGGTMEIGNPYGISNRLQADRGVIALESGYLLVVKYHQAESFPGGESG